MCNDIHSQPRLGSSKSDKILKFWPPSPPAFPLSLSLLTKQKHPVSNVQLQFEIRQNIRILTTSPFSPLPLVSYQTETSSAIACPFKPPYRFSYDDGYHEECDNPDSRVDSCADDNKIIFRQRSCPHLNDPPPSGKSGAFVIVFFFFLSLVIIVVFFNHRFTWLFRTDATSNTS